ncbi:MAG: selenocysteine-specific translation elongation factor [Acidobacteriaceae bacterium]
MKPISIIAGTAGHIDHGKTSLVKALTGIDADRLQEEKRRGITIDLGFAHLELDGVHIGFVDVPGHEKFVRNMLAGVGGIDLVLLVIAADEGVMPQTREHFEICRLLGIERGITVLSKSDAVDAESLAVVRAEVAEFLRGTFLDPQCAPLIAVSAKSGAGMEELKSALVEAAHHVRGRDAVSLPRLPIDRVFTMQGFGTVVTGTLISGTIAVEQEVEIPPSRSRVRVRGIQVHGRTVERASAGERTAVNLASVAKEELHRGQTLVQPQTLAPTHRFEAWLELSQTASPLKHKSRVHVHAFTAEAVAEVSLHGGRELKPGMQGFAQLRIAHQADPMLLSPGDRFIIRSFSPVVTIGGGRVLDPHPHNKRLSGEALLRFLQTLRDGTAMEQLLARIERRGGQGITVGDALGETGWAESRIEALAKQLEDRGEIVAAEGAWISAAAWQSARDAILVELGRFHEKNPLAAGVGKELLKDRVELDGPVYSALLSVLVKEKKIVFSNDLIHLTGHRIILRTEESAAQQTIEAAFTRAGLKVPAVKEVLQELPIDRIRAQKIVTLLLRDKALIKVTEELLFHRSALESLKQMMQRERTKSPQLDVARFKDLTGVSRKYAIPLLEWLDRERVTRRVGEGRVIL